MQIVAMWLGVYKHTYTHKYAKTRTLQDDNSVETLALPSDADSDEVARRVYENHGGRTSLSTNLKASEKQQRVNELCTVLDQELLMTARKMRCCAQCLSVCVCACVCVCVCVCE